MFDQICLREKYLSQNDRSLLLSLEPKTALECQGRKTRLWLCTMVLLAIFTSACAAPGQIDGIVKGAKFQIIDQNPAVSFNQEKEEIAVLLAEQDNEMLRLVTLELDGTGDLQEGDVFRISSEQKECFSLKVSTGDLEVIQLGNGEQVLSSRNNVFSYGVMGTLKIDAFDEYFAGTISVELDDGGQVEGHFLVSR